MTNRRDFIRKSALGTAAITIGGMKLSAKSYKSIQGANERVTVAVIGIGGQGGTHISSFCRMQESKNVRLKTLCDADEKFFPARVKTVESMTKETPTTVWDMRRVLEDKEIDAVSFATPNFWHALGNDLGLPGREACICREAGNLRCLRREKNG